MALILPDPGNIDRTKLTPAETGHSGVIFGGISGGRPVPLEQKSRRRRGGRRRAVSKKGTQLSLELLSVDFWAFSVRADLFLEHMFDSLLVHHQANIVEGQKADGTGAQAPLTPKVAKRQRISQVRGVQTGFFANTLLRTRITGSTAVANVKMRAHPKRAAFIATEASRGNEYLYVEGASDTVLTEAARQVLEASIDLVAQ